MLDWRLSRVEINEESRFAVVTELQIGSLVYVLRYKC